MKLKLLRSALAGLALVTVSASALAETYTVKAGDTLSKLRPNDWQAVCQLNKLASCNTIVVGRKLELPEGVTPRAAKRAEPKAATPKTPRVALPVRNDAGEILYRRVGTAPLKDCGKMDPVQVSEAAWEVIGLSQEDRAYLRKHIDQVGPRIANRSASKEGLIMIPNDVRLEKVTFCRQGKVVAVGPMRTAWGSDKPVPAERFVLPSGKALAWMAECYNWIPVDAPPPPPVVVEETPPAPVPPRVEPLPPTTPLVIEEPPPPTKVTEAPKPRGLCDSLDPAAVIGQEHEPRQNGDSSHSTFLTASVYCLTRLPSDDGLHGYGGKVTYSDWHGTVNNRAGHYQGWNVLVGPSHKHVMDEGYDWEVSAGVGKQVEKYHEGAYASRREFDLVGVTAGYNDYRRRLAGETWDVERQYFGSLTLPVGKKVGHTIFNQPIADTAELGRFNFGVQAGARWWFYENTDQFPLLPYLQGGIFVQHPTSASMSLRIGVADQDRVCGVGVGIDQDLQNGGDPVGAVGWWCDLIRGGQVVRAKVRKHQVITEAASRGVTIEERGGFIQTIRFGEPTK